MLTLDESSFVSVSASIGTETRMQGAIAIGEKARIGSGTILIDCVIGKDCKIGSGVYIQNSILWDGADIADNCLISGSLLAGSVTLDSGCRLDHSTILCDGVRLPAGKHVSAFQILSTHPPDAVDFGGSLIKSSRGVPPRAHPLALINAGHTPQSYHAYRVLRPRSKTSEMSDASESSDLDDESEDSEHEKQTATASDMAQQDFNEEVRLTVTRILKENQSREHAFLELGGLRYGGSTYFGLTSWQRSFQCFPGAMLREHPWNPT